MDVKLPKLGEGAESGVVVSILVKEGDRVTEGQTILELENEKAVAPIPATVSGVVTRIRVKEGDRVSVGAVLLTLDSGGKGGKSAASAEPEPEPEVKPARKTAAAPASPVAPAAVVVPAVASVLEAIPQKSEAPIAAAPAIRRLASELGIDLARVRGTERGGRIGMKDLRTYVELLQRLAFQRPAEAPAAGAAGGRVVESVDFAKWGRVTRKPLSSLRKTIAKRMSESWQAVPRVTQFDEADVTALNELRKKHAKAYEAKGVRLTLTSFAVKAVAEVLRKHPVFNSSLDEAAGELVLKEYVHVGLAVDTEAGLIVPVIRDADQKGLLEISKDIEALAAKARDRKVSLEELKGGSFTISNQGGIGGGAFTPVINLPEVAILGMGRGALKPVVREGKVEPRLMVPLGLSYDHRVIDGGTAARFVVDLVKAFETFPEAAVKL
jgi:pyruvate dehydrogenase E2 component (dihydrolipoamide acetyltransferase)